MILDESDKLTTNSSSLPNLSSILQKCNFKESSVSLWAFSATKNKASEEYLSDYMQNPSIIRVSSDAIQGDVNIKDDSPNQISEFFVSVPPNLSKNLLSDWKADHLCSLMKSLEFNQSIVFYNHKIFGEDFVHLLKSRNLVKSALFHSDQT